MRAALVLSVVLVVACSGPASASPSATSSRGPSPSPFATGGIVEYVVPAPSTVPADCFTPCAASLGDVALGPDGNVWFVDFNRSQVGRVTPDGKFAQFPVPSPTGGARTIAAGPDGNVWLTARGGQGETDWIVRVTQVGALTKFPAGSGSHTAPESITTGPDGNLWFTEVFGNAIGRMTPSGTLTEFPVAGNPRGITAGPDGALWFTASSSVGRITVQGQMTLYPVGNDPSLPLGDIASGPDGNLWFTQNSALRHISPSGRQIVTVPLPPDSHPGSVAKGPDGNVWFTDSGLKAIVRMNVAGSIRPFPLARLSALQGITVGADGRMWFSEADSGRMASIGLKVPEPSFSQGVGLSPRVMIFPDTSPRTITVTNTGDAALAIGTVKVSGIDSSAFAKANDACSGRSIAPGANCKVTLAHSSGGAAGVVQSALLEFPDNGTGSPQRLSLVAQLRLCKLPVAAPVTNKPAQGELMDTTTGHFLYVPGGVFGSTASPARINTSAQPVLVGASSGYFDSQMGRWLPVPNAAWVSPDGSRYAYMAFDSDQSRELHVVDVASGRDRRVPLPAQGFWWLIAFTDQGLYVNQQYEGVAPGLSLVDPDTGAMRQLLTDDVVYEVNSSSAWTAVWNPADKLPQPPGIGGNRNEIDRRDLTTGARTSWYYAPGSNVFVVAVVDGAPVISAWDGVTTKWVIAKSPTEALPMSFPFSEEQFGNFSGFIADPQGVWVGSTDGVYLWTARTGGILVSDEPGTPAGPCA